MKRSQFAKPHLLQITHINGRLTPGVLGKRFGRQTVQKCGLFIDRTLRFRGDSLAMAIKIAPGRIAQPGTHARKPDLGLIGWKRRSNHRGGRIGTRAHERTTSGIELFHKSSAVCQPI